MSDSTSAHRETWDLIPWVVNGRAAEAERLAVERHLRSCADCLREYQFQQQLHAGLSADGSTSHDAEPGLQQLLARIEAPQGGSAAVPQPRLLLRLLAAAVVIETVGLALAGGALWRSVQEPAYVTLSAPAPVVPQASIRLVPAPELKLAQFQALLRDYHLRIAAGPSEAGVYTLAPLTPADRAATREVLARLRAEPGVRFAEPVDDAAGSSP